MRRRAFLATCLCAACAGPAAAAANGLVEAHMHFVPADGADEVALTLDACMGATDHRILDLLISAAIPATIFATRLWLEANPDSVATLKAHPDLLRVENHGARHLAAVIGPVHPYGVTPAGSVDGLFAEVLGGQQAVIAALGSRPAWYRDATALYGRDAMALVGDMGQRIAGFSLNGDVGASVSAATATQRIAAAKPGDVIIAHINQPHREAGAGVAAALTALLRRGVRFRHLDEVEMVTIG